MLFPFDDHPGRHINKNWKYPHEIGIDDYKMNNETDTKITEYHTQVIYK